MNTFRFQVFIEQDEDGVFVADVPALVGCHTQGDTREEALENIKDAIAVCLAQLADEGEDVDIGLPISISVVDTKVPV